MRIIVGFSPGGATDQIARLLAKDLSEIWSQPVVVENRPGASGNIAHGLVAHSPGNGYTLLFTSAPLTISPSLYRNLDYDALRDFKPVMLVAIVPSLLLVPAASPLKSFEDLMKHAGSHPGRLSYASAGNGTPQHLAMELLKAKTGLRIVHVPYNGGAPAIAGLIGGQTDLMFAALPEAAPQVASGRLRALAISSLERSELLPDLPTVSEAGVTGFNAVGWQGILAPGDTPRHVVMRIHAALNNVLARAETRSRIKALGLRISGAGPRQFHEFLAGELLKWADVVKRSGARVD
ncbi:MAG: tripartite tricarboxylate transporter substrate binding protein [Lautropia sp.]